LARDLLGWDNPRVEEIEREVYMARDAWAITLSGGPVKVIGLSFVTPYKRFFIDSDTGEVLGVVIRQLASR
jgi:hypothetical protein